MTDSKTKVCKLCNIEKPLEEYYSFIYLGKIKGKQIRYLPRCKDCYRENEKNKYVKKERTRGVLGLPLEKRKELYDWVKSGKSLRELRQKDETFNAIFYGTLYMATKPEKLEKLIV